MADFDNRVARASTTVDYIDAGLRAYMLRVYNYMLVALVVTGLAAYAVYTASVTTDPINAGHMANGQIAQIARGVMLTNFGLTLFTTPLRWLVILAPLGLVFFLGFRIRHMSMTAAQVTFWVFSGLIGVSMATIFMVYTAISVAQVFFITAAAFGGLSLWGYTTKRDLTGFGSFLIMGLWGLIIASVVNLFLHSPMMMWVISIAGVGIFAGLTAYDTQKIKEMYYVGDDGTVTGKKAIMGALSLYLDFINMFQFLLYLMGNRR
jgi:FtsH-binding integral membrane protein